MVILRTLQVFFKLLPSILALKKDRKIWIAQEKKDIDQEQFRGHARRILNTCVSLGPVYIKFGQWLSSMSFFSSAIHFFLSFFNARIDGSNLKNT